MTGEIAALACALCWAISARIYRHLGASFSALSLNLWKGIIAIVGLYLIAVFAYPDYQLTQNQMLLLMSSGAIGIGIGDTCFFLALKRLGDSNTLFLTETSAPIITAFMAILWLGEWLTPIQWLAMALVIASVALVIKLQSKQQQSICANGLMWAVLAACCQAVGAVVSRDIFTSTNIDAANASVLRIIGGLAMVLAIMIIRKERFIPKSDNLFRTFIILSVASSLGMLLGIYLMMLSFSLTKAAVAQTLFTSCVIMSFVIAYFLGDRFRKSVYASVMVAVAGIVLMI